VRNLSTRIKICGITSVHDALSAVQAGADAIGCVFYPPSPRNVSIEQAIEIRAALPPMVSLVALVVNMAAADIRKVLEFVQPDLIQYHGDESSEFCAEIGHPYWKAVRVRGRDDVEDAVKIHSGARALLLDAWVDGIPGGTGAQINSDLMPDNVGRPWILAGGLNPLNVADALKYYHPAAVDVSSGVEVSPGIKDLSKIRAFISAVKQWDEAQSQ
jgi:phosphoribosylanthranilate isomerase